MQFSNRWLIGVFLVNLVFVSGLLTLATAVALLFRCLDLPDVMRWLRALGFGDDIQRALFPAFLLFACWFIAWIVSYWRSGPRATGGVARVFAILLIVSLLIAIAGLLGTGDIDIRSLARYLGVPQDEERVKQFVDAVETVLAVVLIGFVALGLLPYIRPRLLIRSGVRPSNPVERFVFWFATRTLLVGMPLFLFAVLARENISSYNEERDTLAPADVKDRLDFWQSVLHEAKSKQEPGASIWQAARDEATKQASPSLPLDDAEIMRFVMQSDADDAQAAVLDRQLPDWERWLLLLNCWHSHHENQLTRIVELWKGAKARRDAVFDAITRKVLADRELPQKLTLAPLAVLLSGTATAADTPAKADPERQALQRKSLETAAALRLRWDQSANATPQERKTLLQEIARNNRNLLKLHYATSMPLVTPCYATTVAVQDQWYRLRILGWTFALFVIASLLVNMNDTSLHGFYRNELSGMWIEEVPGFGRTIPLSRLETTSAGAPFHVLSATVNLLGRKRGGTSLAQRHFQFSQAYCGSDATGYQSTDKYMSGRYDLGNAMAISGAAVTPLQIQNPLVSLLLLILNFRLGQWLPNPAIPGVATDVTPMRLLIDLFRSRDRRHYCFVTDGGHYDNLGLEPLLNRRCRLIVVSDATCDPQYGFSEFLRVLQRVRIEKGIQLYALEQDAEVPLDAVVPRQDGQGDLARSHFFAARIRYPDPEKPSDRAQDAWGLLLYLKPTFTGDEGIELCRYRCQDNEFPHESTVNQIYSEQQFEAYRQLGEHSGDALCRQLPADLTRCEVTFQQLAESLASRPLPELARPQPPLVAAPQPGAEPTDVDLRAVISQLPEADTPEHLQQLIDSLAHALPEVRAVAYKLLWDVAPARPEMEAKLQAGLQHANPAVRRSLVRLLGVLRPVSASLSAALEQLREDPDQAVRREAARVLKKRATAGASRSDGA
jgi:hypothetical protein